MYVEQINTPTFGVTLGEVCKKYSDFVTKRSGGDRAVAEACRHILKKFFNKDIEEINLSGKFSGEWTA